MKTITLGRNSIYSSLRRCGLFLIPLVLVCFGIAPMAQAVGPDTDGSIPGSNNGEGIGVLITRTTGVWNTGTGFEALNHLTAGNQNTATGLRALNSDINGGYNTATGVYSLSSNTIGFFNSATGAYSLANNTTGIRNTANGYVALVYNTTGNNNTAEGFQALGHNTTGLFNIAVGSNAGINLTTGSNNIDMGNRGGAGESDKIRIGTVGTQTATFIAGIHGVAVTGAAVVVNGSGQLGVAPSSERFKAEIKPMGNASEALLSLRPVTFRYKKNIDPKGAPQFGLVAEEVEKVNPDLVVRDAEGKVFTVRYEAVNAMLLNEFLKEHRKVQEQEASITQLASTVARQETTIAEQGRKTEKQEATITQLRTEMETVIAQLKEQAAQIQKVSAQLEASKTAPQIVLNNQ